MIIETEFNKIIGDIFKRLGVLERYSGGGTGGGAVTSVNGLTGTVVLDADDISDATTTNKFTTVAEISKLAGIEAGAEVNNISDANATDLTDGNQTTLHKHRASDVNVDTTNFDNNLSSADDTVQKALETLDELTTGGSGSASYVTGEVPSGTINGSNVTFTLSDTPVSGKLQLYVNGVRQKITEDYTISGLTITMVVAPVSGDLLLADYLVDAGTFVGSDSFIDEEIPTGTINGSNTTFTLVSTPITGSLKLYRDGQLMKGGGADYTLTGNSIAFVTAPESGSVLVAYYRKQAASAGDADTIDGLQAVELSPPGIVAPYAGASAPAGWLLADGSAVSRSTYAALFAVVGTTYGVGDGSTTFNLPDLRGVFVKGAGTTSRAAGKDASGNYYSATLGEYLTDKMQGHKHSTDRMVLAAEGYGHAYGGSGSYMSSKDSFGDTLIGVPMSDGTNGTPRTGHTTEPQSLGLNYIIKT